MKKILMALFSVCAVMVMMWGNVKANDEEALADLYANPSEYICYGMYGMGESEFLDKRTINVHEYNPPYYIIAFKSVRHVRLYKNKEYVTKVYTRRYYYNYDTRKMYYETYDKNGNQQWVYVNEKDRTWKGEGDRHDGDISGGELAFYLAYHMHYFGHPVGREYKRYIDEGRSYLGLDKLYNNGDTTIWHYYNHRTNKIEGWKYIHQNGKRDTFVRIL